MLLIVGPKICLSQVLVQDATNATTLVYQGTTINVDAAQARASFSVNSFANNKYADSSKHFYWGIQASADNKKGLGGILKTGSIVPNADFKLTIGRTWTNGLISKVNNDKQAELRGIKLNELDWHINKLIWAKFNSLKFELVDTTSVKEILNSPYDSISVKMGKYSKTNREKDSTLFKQLRIGVDLLLKIRETENKKEGESPDNRFLSLQRFWNDRYVLYAIIEGSASKFTYLKNPTNTDYGKRFVDTTSQSPKFGLGFNWQRGGTFVFGVSATHERLDNFNILKEKEYTLLSSDKTKTGSETTDPNVTTTTTKIVEGKKTFTAYDGNYRTYWSTSINCDFARFFPGERSDKTTIVWHSYARQSFSWFKEAFPEITKIGMGIYAFKDNGTFSGGLYLEVNDVFNNIERLKKEPNFQPAYERISFGLVTKVALNSIVSYR